MESPVVCLRCGATYDPDDTVCFTCGAPLGETRTPTQPVPIPKTAKLHAITSAPAAGPMHLGDDMHLTGVRPVVSPPRLTAQAPVGRARGQRRWPLVALALVLVVALALGADIVVRKSLAGPPVPYVVSYRDARDGFSLRLPELWSVTPEPDGVLLSDSDNPEALTSMVRVSVSAVAAGQDAQTAAGQLASGLQAPASATQQYGGATWQQRLGDYTGADGAAREEVILVTVHANRLYAITCASPLDTFDATYRLVYAPLLRSFRFSA